jgi:hypothetical protein
MKTMEEKRKSPTSKPAAILPDAFGRVQPQALLSVLNGYTSLKKKW